MQSSEIILSFTEQSLQVECPVNTFCLLCWFMSTEWNITGFDEAREGPVSRNWRTFISFPSVAVFTKAAGRTNVLMYVSWVQLPRKQWLRALFYEALFIFLSGSSKFIN